MGQKHRSPKMLEHMNWVSNIHNSHNKSIAAVNVPSPFSIEKESATSHRGSESNTGQLPLWIFLPFGSDN